MFGKNDVLKLAALSRLSMSEEEAEKISKEMGSILNYVSMLSNASASNSDVIKNYHNEINQFREDGVPHESGFYSEKLLAEAPMREGNFLKVKKIL